MNRPPLRLYPNPSRILLIYLIILHLSACLCILLTDLPGLLKGAMLLLCALSFIHHLHKPTIVFLMGSHQWQLLDEQGNLSTHTLCSDSIATQNLLILNFKGVEGGKLSLPLPSDTLPPNDYRRLRARLLSDPT